jgi:hypothetical protein
VKHFLILDIFFQPDLILPASVEEYLLQIPRQSQGPELRICRLDSIKPCSVSFADCGSLNGGLRCACEDGYTWFSPSCLDPQNCYLRTTGSLPSCECHLNNLNLSVNFCERASKQRILSPPLWAGASPTPACNRGSPPAALKRASTYRELEEQ